MAFGNWLPYMTGGFAWTFDRVDLESDHGDAEPAAPPAPALIEHHWLWRFGWTIGAGIEFPFAPNWTARAEYLFTDFGNQRRDISRPSAQRIDANLTISQLRFGLNYRLPERSAPDGSSITADKHWPRPWKTLPSTHKRRSSANTRPVSLAVSRRQ